jgi:hypothetical protein
MVETGRMRKVYKTDEVTQELQLDGDNDKQNKYTYMQK